MIEFKEIIREIPSPSERPGKFSITEWSIDAKDESPQDFTTIQVLGDSNLMQTTRDFMEIPPETKLEPGLSIGTASNKSPLNIFIRDHDTDKLRFISTNMHRTSDDCYDLIDQLKPTDVFLNKGPQKYIEVLIESDPVTEEQISIMNKVEMGEWYSYTENYVTYPDKIHNHLVMFPNCPSIRFIYNIDVVNAQCIIFAIGLCVYSNNIDKIAPGTAVRANSVILGYFIKDPDLDGCLRFIYTQRVSSKWIIRQMQKLKDLRRKRTWETI